MKKLDLHNCDFEEREGYERAVLFSNDDFAGNTKLQLMRLPSGQIIRPHHHNIRTECFRIVSGNGQIIINSEIVATSQDDIVLCQPGDIHEFINLSMTEPFTFLVIRTNDPDNDDMVWES